MRALATLLLFAHIALLTNPLAADEGVRPPPKAASPSRTGAEVAPAVGAPPSPAGGAPLPVIVTGRGHWAPMVPLLSFALGSASGSGSASVDFKAGLEKYFGVSDAWDFSLAATASAGTTNNNGQLFLLDQTRSDQVNPTFAGSVVVTFIKLQPIASISSADVSVFNSMSARVRQVCLSVVTCSPYPIEAHDQAWCKALGKHVQSGPGSTPENFIPDPTTEACNTAFGEIQAMVDASPVAQARREQGLQFPPVQVSVGFSVGATRMEDLEASTPASGAPLVDTTHTKPKAAAGVTGTWVWNSGFTLEAITSFSYRWSPPSAPSATWCIPQGMVVTGSTTVPAQTCNTLPIGAPTEAGDLAGGVFAGWVDERHGSWRGSLGVVASPRLIPIAAGGFAASVQAPFYFDALHLSTPLSGSGAGVGSAYRGIFRVVPAFTVTTSKELGTDYQFGVTLQLLGQKTLFGRALDYQ